MLSIDRRQQESLRGALRAAYRRKLGGHVRRFFPAHAALAGDAGLDALVDLAQARAGNRGYVAEREVALWLNLMVLLGVAFDEDALLPWRGALPGIARPADSFATLNAIYDSAEDYLDKIAGPFQAAAMGRFLQSSPQELVVQPSQSSEHLVNSMARLYPEKYQAADFPALQAFMQATIADCLKAGINVKDRIVLLMLFDFILGRDAHASPLYAPTLTRAGADALAGLPIPELLDRMRAVMRALQSKPSGGQ